MRKNILPILLAASVLLVGCDSAEESSGTVQVQFRLADGAQTLNKTSEFELDRANDDSCDLLADGEDDDHCEKFESLPFFVDLPLDNRAVTVASSSIDPDDYKELDFEIEDLGDDDFPTGVAEALLAQIRTDHPDWPDRASMAFVGEFETTGGEVRTFTRYAQAEIEIEMAFDPPITIDAGSADITVVVDPTDWMKAADGSVLDLSTVDNLFEFEVEIENGFKEVEFDD
jgi:hypothetical protein